MRTVLNKYTCLILFALMGLIEDHYGQSPTSAPGAATPTLQSTPAKPWTFVPAYSWSFFNKARDSWQRESLDLYYRLAEEPLVLGASIDMLHRSPSGDDTMYGLNAAWYPLKELELHGEISLTHDADFMPSERYSLGMQYRPNRQLGFLFDAEQMNFGAYAPTWDDGITQIKPGISYWFTEDTSLTLRYIHGWVHDESDYDYYSAIVRIGNLPREGQLILGFAYGTDPDIEFGSNETTLSDAYTLSLFYKEPINPDLSIYAGLEYVYRLRADNDNELYQMWTPTIGLSWKF